jgi:ribosome maturation factor RimP
LVVLKKEVTNIIEQSVDKNKFFIVDLHILPFKGLQTIKLIIDSDCGIGIDDCAEVSRTINKAIEDSNLLENYELEVSSPGVGEVLKLERQYLKNIGRNLKIITEDQQSIKGKLVSVDLGSKIILEQTEKLKNKIINTNNTEVLFSNIKKAVVEISFNG